MHRQANHLLYVVIAVVILPLLISACTNDLKKIQEISATQVHGGADTTRGVDVIFSDSAKVKARVLAPLMLDYDISKENKDAYKLMPKGIKIIYFDEKTHKELCNVVADTAYWYESLKLFKMRKAVVITSSKGDVFKSEELNWDMNKHLVTSDKPVDIKMANGNIAHGTSMVTTEKFDHYTIQNQTGLFYVDNKFGQ